MNRIIVLAYAILLNLALLGQKPIVKHLGVFDFKEIISNSNGSLIDVRTQQEFANGHIKNAGQLNYYALDFNKKLLMLPRNKPIFLYCNTGYRSKKAAKTLILNGYQQVYNLEKGIMAWNLANYKVIVEKNAKPFLADKINEDEYFAFIEFNKNVMIDFYAPWCSPCQKMMPAIDSLGLMHKDKLQVLKVNVDASKKLVRELQIKSVPYFTFYKNGKLIKAHNGFMNDNDMQRLINSIYNNN